MIACRKTHQHDAGGSLDSRRQAGERDFGQAVEHWSNDQHVSDRARAGRNDDDSVFDLAAGMQLELANDFRMGLPKLPDRAAVFTDHSHLFECNVSEHATFGVARIPEALVKEDSSGIRVQNQQVNAGVARALDAFLDERPDRCECRETVFFCYTHGYLPCRTYA